MKLHEFKDKMQNQKYFTLNYTICLDATNWIKQTFN